MRLLFLGTAAAEGLPALWCNCPVCANAKKTGGREIRTRSQILIDDCVMLDFPMDTYMHVINNRLDLSRVDTVLITHAHMDHCYPQEFILHGAPFAHGMTEPHITVYGNKTVKKTFRQATKPEMRDSIKRSITLNAICPFDSFTTEGGYEITALPAKHTKGEDCLIYAVKHNGVTVLLFNDSGILPDETYARMAELNLKFDAISFDCTYGHARHGSGRHMGSLDAAGEREKMKRYNLVHENTKYVLTHFSHNCEMSHAELEQTEKDNNFTVAYDGMKIEID